jgi:hypothetical protein
MASIILKDVRIAFPRLFEAKEYEAGDGKFRYDATFIVSPGSDAEKVINKAYKEAAQAKFLKKTDTTLEMIKMNLQKNCWYEGRLKDLDGYEGNMILAAHRSAKDGAPKVMRRDKSAITSDNGEIYSGCYVNASVEIWAQDGTNTGMRCTFAGIQFLRDGDSFGGAKKSDGSEFDDLGDAPGGDIDADDV